MVSLAPQHAFHNFLVAKVLQVLVVCLLPCAWAAFELLVVRETRLRFQLRMSCVVWVVLLAFFRPCSLGI